MGVSLVAIAAIVASLAVARHRSAADEQRRADATPAPQRAPAAAGIDLDGIRAAGL